MKKKGEKTIFAVLLAALCGASLLGGCAGGVVRSVLSGEASQAETSSAADSSEAVSSEEPVSSEEGIPLQSMIKGTIEDATMNSFVLKTTDGSITFSIGPDTDLSNLPNGLKIGEKVSVQFTGSITGEDASNCVVSRVNPVKS